MAAPVTSIDALNGGVKVEWIAPANNGYTITSYLIEILDQAGTTWSTTSACDGTSSSIVL
jgi:hypothetical protein